MRVKTTREIWRRSALVATTLALVAGGAAPALADSTETIAGASETGPLVLQSPAGNYYGFTGTNTATGAARSYMHPDLNRVLSYTAEFTRPAAGASGEVRTGDAQCLTALGERVWLQACDASEAQVWSVSADGALQPATGGLSANLSRIGYVPFSLGEPTTEWKLAGSVFEQPLTGAVAFAPENETLAVVAGSAQPGAEVRAMRGAEVLATAHADAETGAYEMQIPAPGVGGVFDLSLDQRVGGTRIGSVIAMAVDYGAAVTVDSPQSESLHSGGAVTFSGSGVAGGSVELRRSGDDAVLQRAIVDAAGSWSMTVDLPAENVEYVVQQLGRGANATEAIVALEAPSERRLAIAAPVADTPVAAGTITFTGTAAPHADVRLVSVATGASLGQGAADADGDWAVDVNKQLAAGKYTIQVQSGDDAEARAFVVGAVEVPKFSVKSPAADTTVTPGTVVFAGTATPNSDVRLVSIATGASLGTTIADRAGAWSVAVNKPLGAGSYTIRVQSGVATKDHGFVVR